MNFALRTDKPRLAWAFRRNVKTGKPFALTATVSITDRCSEATVLIGFMKAGYNPEDIYLV